MRINKILYKHFLESKKIYNLNVGFWTQIANKISRSASLTYTKWVNDEFSNGTKFFDGNPIFSAYLKEQKKALRIIQNVATSNTTEISAWIEKTENEKKECIVEFVIDLELTTSSKEIAIDFLKKWIIENMSLENMESYIAKKLKKFVKPVILILLLSSNLFVSPDLAYFRLVSV